MCAECPWEDYLTQIQDAREESIPDLPDAAYDFGQSVDEKLASIADWVETNEHITPKQTDAVDNMIGGIHKWLERD